MSTAKNIRILLSSTSATGRETGWPARLLTVLLPGAGHAYAGYWRRGIVWGGLFLAALAFLSSGVLLAERAGFEPIVVTALRVGGVAFADIGVPFAVLVASLFDLYGLAALDGPADSATLNRS